MPRLPVHWPNLYGPYQHAPKLLLGVSCRPIQLCKQSLADVITSLSQYHLGLTIKVETASPTLGPSCIATLRQASMGNDIHTARQATWIEVDRIFGQRTDSYLESLPTHREVTTVDHVPYDRAPLLSQPHISGSYETLPRYTPRSESAIPTCAHSTRLSRPVLDFLGSIARNSSLMLFGPVRSSLHFLHRNCGIILFLLAAPAVGVGAVYSTIRAVNFVCRNLAAAAHWPIGEWQLLRNAGGNVNAIVAQLLYTVVQAMRHGWHASVLAEWDIESSTTRI